MIKGIISQTPKCELDLHVHTNFCDGKAEPETMVLSAIDKGIKVLGIVTHAYVEFDNSYTIQPDEVELFLRTISELGKKYEGKIKVLAGVEADPASCMSYEGFSYVLGSSHYFCKDGKYASVDASPDVFVQSVNELFSGDAILATENYYEQVKRIVDIAPDLIGHFDLVTKFNEKLHAFDERDPRYERAWKSAANELLKLKVPFEINTGGRSRGWKSVNYPADPILKYLEANGAEFVLSSDAHRPEQIAGHFDEFRLA